MELRELGYVEGQNIAFDFRSAEGKLDRLPELASELVRLKVDVIVALYVPSALAAKQATREICYVAEVPIAPLATNSLNHLAGKRKQLAHTASFAAFTGRALTIFRAGLALNTVGSFVNGLMPARSFVAGFLTTTNFAKPGNKNAPFFFNSL